MQKSELKVLIKQLVRESLTEIFTEMKLESIVENVIKKYQHSDNVSFYENVKKPSKDIDVESSELRKRKLMEAVGGEEMWKNIYGDIKDSNPVLSRKTTQGTPDDNELVDENTLRQAGLFKDYTRFVK